MAQIIQLTKEGKQARALWRSQLPEHVRKIAVRYPQENLYRLTTSGNRCTIEQYHENGTVIVSVTEEFNRVLFNRLIKGVKPENLVECDPPGPDEPLGNISKETGMTEQEIMDLILRARQQQREESMIIRSS